MSAPPSAPSPPTSLFIECAGREIHVRRWGDPSAPVIIAWHGLTRNGADFTALATALADEFCIIAPDTIGRGMSAWAKDKSEYRLTNYAAHAEAMMQALSVNRCHWLGTSMGGLLGMLLAADSDRIDRLILNDIGPEQPRAAIYKIIEYAMSPKILPTMAEFEKYLRETYAGFGALSDHEWRAMAIASHRRTERGITLNHDTRIAHVRAPSVCDWALYARLTCPILIMRGADSDILPQTIADKMLQQQPKAQLATFAECGHAPYLNTPEQIKRVRKFFRG